MIAAATVASAAIVVSACAGAPRRVAEGSAQGPAPLSLGRQVFLTQCQGCHALGALGSRRPRGGDLSHYSMTPAEVASYARIMPTARRLTPWELEGVAAFVAAGQRRGGAGAERARPAG